MNPLSQNTQAGQLDRKIELQSATYTRDAIGQAIPAWVTVAIVWAAWTPTDGREQSAASQLEPTQSGILQIRYRSDVTSLWRVVMNSVNFEITAPPMEIGRRKFLNLSVRALATKTA